MPDRRVAAVLAVAAIAGAGVAAALLFTGRGISRQEVVAERGARVMPFSLDATTHVFDKNATGGTQRVIADAPGDRSEIRLIRQHLREEAEAFRRGEFADPASIHGQKMPGLAALKIGHRRIEVRSRYLPEGAEITYRTSDSRLAAAIGDWFDAQLNDHGADAARGEHSGSDHSTHSAHEH